MDADIFSLDVTIIILISREDPIQIYENKANGIFRKLINYNAILNGYNEYLKKLVFRMTNQFREYRPCASDAYDEIEFIEKFIKNPKSKKIKEFLDNQNAPIENELNKIK